MASSFYQIQCDCMIVCLSSLHRAGCKTYSLDTENTFIDTKNIHNDTVKRYNNYTRKKKRNYRVKTTPLCLCLFTLSPCIFSKKCSGRMAHRVSMKSSWQSLESHLSSCFLMEVHISPPKKTTEKPHRCWPAFSAEDKMWRKTL